MVAFDFRSRLNSLMDSMHNEGITNPLDAVEQVSYLFFLRYLNLRNDILLPEFWWENILQMDDQERLSKFHEIIFPALRSGAAVSHPFIQLMSNSVFMFSKPSLLAEAIYTVDLAFLDDGLSGNSRDSIRERAEAFEFLINKIPATTRGGSVVVEPEIAKLMSAFVKPQLADNVLDPSCAAGSLLVEAIKYQWQNNLAENAPGDNNLTIQWEGRMVGTDLDRNMVRLSSLNLMMHGFDGADISSKNPLVKSPVKNFEVILFNPSLTEWEIVPAVPVVSQRTQRELQYAYRFMDVLARDNGRAAILVTEKILGDLDQESMEIRRKLLDNFDVRAVVSVPVSFSKRFTVPMAILFLTCGFREGTLPRYNGNVWFAELQPGQGEHVIKYYEDNNQTNEPGSLETGFSVPSTNISDDNYNLVYEHRLLQVTLSAKAADSTPVKTARQEDFGLSELTRKLSNLIPSSDFLSEKLALPKQITELLIGFLPLESIGLATYIDFLSLKDILTVFNKSDKNESAGEEVVTLLLNKKAELEAKIAATAREHPYHDRLYNACQIFEPSWPVRNLMASAKKAELKDFSIDQLAMALMSKDLPSPDPRIVKRLLTNALIRFLREINEKFRFQDLQKVLDQLQFLPCYDVLSDIILEGLKPGGQLRQVYLNKEISAPEVVEKTEFIRFSDVPGYMHIVCKETSEAII